MFQWIDMRVTLLRSTEDIIKSLIPPEDGHQIENAPADYNNCFPLDGVIQTCQTTSTQHSSDIHIFLLKRLNSCYAGLDDGIEASTNVPHFGGT